jgi:single-strand DNA-binding protein
MANLNKVMLIGRLTRDPETRTFANGGKVANFGFAVNNPKKNPQTGQWEQEPVFIDIKAFNRETGRKLADQVEQHMRKGQQFYLEGHLTFEQWTSQDGQKQSKLRVILDDFQFFEPRQDGGSGEGGMRGSRPAASSAPRPAAAPASGDHYDDYAAEPEPAPRRGGDEGDIPF